MPKKQRLLSSSEDQTIILWDTICEELINFFSVQSTQIYCLVPNLDETDFYGLGQDEKLRKWNISKEEVVDTLSGFWCAFSDECLAIDSKESVIYGISSRSKNDILVFDNFNKKRVKILEGHEDVINCIKLSEEKKNFISAGDDSVIKIWSTETLELLFLLDEIHMSDVKSICFSLNKHCIMTGGHDKRVCLMSLNDPRKVVCYGKGRYCINKIVYDRYKCRVFGIMDDKPRMVVWSLIELFQDKEAGGKFFILDSRRTLDFGFGVLDFRFYSMSKKILS